MNMQTMDNKQDEHERLESEGKFDFIRITEAWWNDTHYWNAQIEGYPLFRKNRFGKMGRDLALYVNNVYTSSETKWSSKIVKVALQRASG